MKKILYLISGLIMLTLLCSFFSSIFGNSISKKREIAFKITDTIKKRISSKYHLNFLGISEEANDGKYKRLGLELSSEKILRKDEGRRLLLSCAQEALRAYNSNPDFKEYMTDYPFTNKNIIINIYIEPSNNSEVYYPEISVYSFYNNTLYYYTDSPTNQYQYYTEEEESYEDALRAI